MMMASLWERYAVPVLIGCACSSPPIMKQREKVVPHATGRVLELGIGGGLNLGFYDPAKVSEVVGLDPSQGMTKRADTAPRPEGLKVSIVEGFGEDIPLEDNSVDTVVCTFTLCSVHRPVDVLKESRRVLKPGGRFLFCEHGLAPDPEVQKWQHRLEPIWKPFAGGCHMTRPITSAIAANGFKVTKSEEMYLPNSPRILAWNEWGEAVPA